MIIDYDTHTYSGMFGRVTIIIYLKTLFMLKLGTKCCSGEQCGPVIPCIFYFMPKFHVKIYIIKDCNEDFPLLFVALEL